MQAPIQAHAQAPSEAPALGTTQAPTQATAAAQATAPETAATQSPIRNDRNFRSSERFDQKRDPVTFELVDHIGKLSTSSSGWSREVNIVAWNGRQGRLDIRDWDPEHKKMSRGIGLNGTEVTVLKKLLDGFDVGKIAA